MSISVLGIVNAAGVVNVTSLVHRVGIPALTGESATLFFAGLTLLLIARLVNEWNRSATATSHQVGTQPSPLLQITASAPPRNSTATGRQKSSLARTFFAPADDSGRIEQT